MYDDDDQRVRYWLILEALVLMAPTALLVSFITYAWASSDLSPRPHPLSMAMGLAFIGFGILPHVLLFICAIRASWYQRVSWKIALPTLALGLVGTYPFLFSPQPDVVRWIPLPCWVLAAHLLFLEWRRKVRSRPAPSISA